MSHTYSSAEDRLLKKFYERVRLNLDDVETLPIGITESQEAEASTSSGKGKAKDDEIYGVISKNEFEAILDAYDDKSQKSTVCDRFEAGSFAKLLFSKPGFHNPSATEHLVQDLKIKDIGRSSFLGGHSSFQVPDDMSLKSALRRQLTIETRTRVKDIMDRLDCVEDPADIDKEIKEVSEADPSNGNTYIVRGRYNLKVRQFAMAVNELKRGLELGCDEVERVNKYLSAALFERGLSVFNANDFERASEYFADSLLKDENNQSSKLHIRLCQQKILELRRPFGTTNSFQARRR